MYMCVIVFDIYIAVNIRIITFVDATLSHARKPVHIIKHQNEGIVNVGDCLGKKDIV